MIELFINHSECSLINPNGFKKNENLCADNDIISSTEIIE